MDNPVGRLLRALFLCQGGPDQIGLEKRLMEGQAQVSPYGVQQPNPTFGSVWIVIFDIWVKLF